MSELFQIKCQKSIFTQDEISSLERHGHFFHTLTSGERLPETLEQIQFKQVFELELRPQTNEEYTWWKYLTRLEWERNTLEEDIHSVETDTLADAEADRSEAEDNARDMPWNTFLNNAVSERWREPTYNKPITKTPYRNKRTYNKPITKTPYRNKKKIDKSKLSDKDRELIKKELEKHRALDKKDSENPKPSVPEEYRRKADEGIGGSREDWKKNRRKYDG